MPRPRVTVGTRLFRHAPVQGTPGDCSPCCRTATSTTNWSGCVSLSKAVVVAGLLSALSAALATGRATPGEQTTFRTSANIVMLDVSVLDAQGQPVRGLTVDDFTVLEGRQSRPIVAFAAVEVPTWTAGTAPWTHEVGPDIASNRIDAQRVVVILMDDCATRWDPGVMRDAKAIAAAVIDQLGPVDLAAVVHVLNQKAGQEFTVDRALLRAAVERFVPSGGAAPESRFVASSPSGGLVVASRPPGPSAGCRRDGVASALENVGRILYSWPGARKTVVLVSPGLQSSGIEDRLTEAFERGRMFAALQRANVNVYQFDPHGLQTTRDVLFSDFGTFAENTGGRAVTNTNAPAALVPQMFRENSSYYLLGLRADDSRDGQFHRINVNVNRSGVHVRARAGYYAATDRPPEKPEPMSTLEHALSGGLPAGDLPFSVTVAPFSVTGKPGAALAVAARLDHEADLAKETVFELLAVAFNDRWKQVTAVTQRFILRPSNKGARFPEMMLRLNVPPGRYEIRTAARNTADGRTGSVYTSVAVPDFNRESLSLSGLVVERRSSGVANFENSASIVPARMTTVRLFSPNDQVAVVARVYQRRVKSLAQVRVSARIVDAHDRAALTAETTLEPSSFDAERQADYRLELPLSRFTDGEYLLVLDARTGSTSVRRTLRFAVRR